jgi:hypothetical protein
VPTLTLKWAAVLFRMTEKQGTYAMFDPALFCLMGYVPHKIRKLGRRDRRLFYMTE